MTIKIAKLSGDRSTTRTAGLSRGGASSTRSSIQSWGLAITSFLFILLQSACTFVIAVSGLRLVIGLSALAAAAGLNRPASGFHADAIRIPMMVIAVGGSLINLYVIWRIRSLRARSSSQWRAQPVAASKKRSEMIPDRAGDRHTAAGGRGVRDAPHRPQRLAGYERLGRGP